MAPNSLTVIARSSCDEAIQFFVGHRSGLLRFARNDVVSVADHVYKSTTT
jgi:hypothetical protein